jgi:hypothetical protein
MEERSIFEGVIALVTNKYLFGREVTHGLTAK